MTMQADFKNDNAVLEKLSESEKRSTKESEVGSNLVETTDTISESLHQSDPQVNSGNIILRVHPQRLSLYEELHSRPSPIIDHACQIVHLTVTMNNNRERLYDHVVDLCTRYSVPVPAPESNCLYQDFGGFELRWERHLEFSNFTFICNTESPFNQNLMQFIPKDWLANMPGELVVALNLAVSDQQFQERDVQQWFEGQRTVGSWVADGRAQVLTTFRLHSDGFGRMLLCNNELTGYQTGRLVQRLCELETYRLMSLLALPIARKMGHALTRIEDDLATLNHNISEIDAQTDERDLLQQLSRLAADVEQHRSNTNFRFAASVAYHDLVNDRLGQLKEYPIDHTQGLQEFLQRRLTPGIKTCNSVRDQLEDLSRRVHRTTSLLRTRVDLAIQEQNQDLLASMNRRSQLQLRLQQAVEGVSVVAISYYMLALLKFGFVGLRDMGVDINVDMATAAATPVILLSVYGAMRFLRRKIHHRVDSKTPKS